LINSRKKTKKISFNEKVSIIEQIIWYDKNNGQVILKNVDVLRVTKLISAIYSQYNCLGKRKEYEKYDYEWRTRKMFKLMSVCITFTSKNYK
jgi:hypothetical protein